MTRTIATANKNETTAEVFRPVLFLFLDLDGGDVTVNSSDQDIAWDFDGDSSDETFTGVGQFGSVSVINESADLKASGIQCMLTGVPTTHISNALSEDYSGRTAKLYIGFLNASRVLVADPMVIFAGRIDAMDIQIGKTASVSVSIESKLVDWERARIRRYTNEDQRNLYSTDEFCEFVVQTVEKELVWGQKT
jgi:hypothetical protein